MVLAALVILSSPRRIPAQSQASTAQHSCGEFKKSAAQLNRVYQQVLAKHGHDMVFAQHFKAAQRAWIAFRDAELNAIYPPEKNNEAGSVLPMCQCDNLTELTNARVKQLQEWLTSQEGDVCAGTRWP